MCLGSSKPSAPPPAPAPAPLPPPTPTITPSEVSAQTAGEARRRQVERLRYGMASTIKTRSGMFGSGAQLAGQATGKTTLG